MEKSSINLFLVVFCYFWQCGVVGAADPVIGVDNNGQTMFHDDGGRGYVLVGGQKTLFVANASGPDKRIGTAGWQNGSNPIWISTTSGYTYIATSPTAGNKYFLPGTGTLPGSLLSIGGTAPSPPAAPTSPPAAPTPSRLLNGHQIKWVPIVRGGAASGTPSSLRLSIRVLGARSTPAPAPQVTQQPGSP